MFQADAHCDPETLEIRLRITIDEEDEAEHVLSFELAPSDAYFLKLDLSQALTTLENLSEDTDGERIFEEVAR